MACRRPVEENDLELTQLTVIVSIGEGQGTNGSLMFDTPAIGVSAIRDNPIWGISPYRSQSYISRQTRWSDRVGSCSMTTVAVVAHKHKHLGGGLPELRHVLANNGIADPLWYEVGKSSEAPKYIREAIKLGTDLIFVWGGDGMVQNSIDALADSGVPIAILPAGTANLLATNLGIPKELTHAVDIGLRGIRRTLDVGLLNGERFAVMAGAGFDARIMGKVDQEAKKRFGRLAYIVSGFKAMKAERCRMKIKVDGDPWFEGKASCVLFANVGTITGGLKVFPDAEPDDGILEIGVVTAKGWLEWLRVLIRVVARDTSRSPMLMTTRGRKISVRLGRSMPYELDGGARKKTKKLKVQVVPHAVRVCVPKTVKSR